MFPIDVEPKEPNLPVEVDSCPNCGVNLIGEEIPKDQRHHFGGNSHFSRKIGRYDVAKDRTTKWSCPDCKHSWGA